MYFRGAEDSTDSRGHGRGLGGGLGCVGTEDLAGDDDQDEFVLTFDKAIRSAAEGRSDPPRPASLIPRPPHSHHRGPV